MAKKTAPPAKISKQDKRKYIIAGVSFVVIAVVIYLLFIFQGLPKRIKTDGTEGEIKDAGELALVDKPYVTLTPTSDGAEIIISIEKMSYFDRIEYELTYLADNPQAAGDKIQRGATGTDVNTKDEKYKKSILLGTASKGVRSPDRGIVDGKLTMHLFKGDIEYQSQTEFNLVEIGASETTVKDSQGKVSVDVPATLGKTYWVILSDTVGIVPTFDKDPASVVTPVWGTFSVAPKFTKNATLTLELGDLGQKPQIHLYTQDGKWETKDLKAEGDAYTYSLNSFATFVVTSSK